MKELSDLRVLIVDCQTTGASPAHGSVLEIGWGVAKAGLPGLESAEAHWVALPPGHVVPFQVRRLTGFDEADLTTELRPEEAWQRLRSALHMAGPIPAAIHFAHFELAFLRDWASRFEPEGSFPLDAVCVHAIACRLYPDLPRRSLRALAGYLGHGVDPARRCLGHVEATAFIWCKLATELAARGVHGWDELRDWAAAPRPMGSRPRKRRYPLPSERYRSLPDAPGVYRLVRSNGDVLYVGKAASLRKRVGSHFTAGFYRTERALEMLTQVHDIQITPTPTALEAALLEIENIKALQPPYNVQLVGGETRTWFTNTRLDAAATEPDETYRWGPLPSTFAVRALGAIHVLAAGERATRALRARAVEAPERWAPDEQVFAAGFACFARRHDLVGLGSSSDVHRAIVIAARKLILASKFDPATRADAELAGDDANAGPGDVRLWDIERVVRHLERALMHGYQLLQRARWLCLLHDSAVVFQETPTQRPRLLTVRGGRLSDVRDFAPDESVPTSVAPRSLRERRAAVDRYDYDRLRTLTTELKRVLRDQGTAAVRVGRGRWLRGSALEALLLWV